jgi:drug/metabolite transporter (DMT)-like permease
MSQSLTSQAQSRATLVLIFTTAIWGFTFVTNQSLLKTITAIDIMTWRFGIAAMLLIAFKPSALKQLDRRTVLQGIILGVLLSIGYVTQLVGLKTTTATASGFITGLFVIFTPIISSTIFRQRITKVAWIAVLLTTIGLGLLALKGWTIGRGDLLTLICAFVFACHIVGLGQWSRGHIAYALTAVQISVVFLISLVVSLAHGGPALNNTQANWRDLVFLAVFATCLCFFGQTWAQSKLTATRTGIILTLEPVFCGIAAVTIAHDQPTNRMITGALLILVAMYLIELDPTQRRTEKAVRLEP